MNKFELNEIVLYGKEKKIGYIQSLTNYNGCYNIRGENEICVALHESKIFKYQKKLDWKNEILKNEKVLVHETLMKNFKYFHYDLETFNTPKNVIFNDKKKATTLIFDNKVAVVKCGKDDTYNRRIGFLEAYFQANCGMSKNKANKYLEEIVKDKEKSK